MMDIEKHKRELGGLIETRRIELGYSINHMCRATGLTFAIYKSIEAGSARYTYDSLIKVINALGYRAIAFKDPNGREFDIESLYNQPKQ